jgi:hypothetical protein
MIRSWRAVIPTHRSGQVSALDHEFPAFLRPDDRLG